MKSPSRRSNDLDPVVRDEVVAFLRDWLPASAMEEYRQMMREDPAGWHRHPHFGGGVILERALRGNGLDERALGVTDLEPLWPDLLRRAVGEPERRNGDSADGHEDD